VIGLTDFASKPDFLQQNLSPKFLFISVNPFHNFFATEPKLEYHSTFFYFTLYVCGQLYKILKSMANI